MSGASAADKIPSRPRDWENFVKERQLEGKTVHAAELASGSKIGYNQYLLLRVLWVDHKRNGQLPENINKLLPKAIDLLANYPSWKKYCDSFGSMKNPEGSFSVARHYQKMAISSKEDTGPNSFDTPIARRTRSRVNNNKMPNISKLDLNPPKPPATGQTGQPETPVPSSDEELESSDEESSTESPSAQAPEELQKRMYPPTKDEQIVNTALVIFLNALTIHFNDNISCNWTIHRKGFIAKFTKASFEARTDGYLDDGEENAYALIEVKPVIRAKKQKLIRMQESAQMVGWLMNDSTEDGIDRMRILISQNRHEIFVTFAEYDDNYLAYLKGRPSRESENESSQGNMAGTEVSKSPASETAGPSFLTMHQYGPWNTQERSHMAALGPILLAISLHGEAVIRRARHRKTNM